MLSFEHKCVIILLGIAEAVYLQQADLQSSPLGILHFQERRSCVMNAEQLVSLRRIYEKAKDTPDGYAISVTLGISGDQRKEVCHYLEKHGYIKKYVLFGKDKVGCYITNRTRDFFYQK